MKRIAILAGLAVIAVLVALVWPQLGTGQFFGGSSDSGESQKLRQEIAMLRLVNELELTADQMTALKNQIAQIQASYTGVKRANVELKDFLVGFKGTREEHREAVKPFNEKVAQAEEAFHKQLQASVEAVKDLFTFRQGEILQEHFGMMHPLMGEGMLHRAPLHAMKGHHPGDFNIQFEISPDAKRAFAEKLESKLERWGERMEAWGERIGAEIEDWFEDWDVASEGNWNDGHRIRIYRRDNGDEEWEVYPADEAQLYGAPGPMMMDHGPFIDHLMAQLEVLDRVLTDKLMKLTPAPGQSQV